MDDFVWFDSADKVQLLALGGWLLAAFIIGWALLRVLHGPQGRR